VPAPVGEPEATAGAGSGHARKRRGWQRRTFRHLRRQVAPTLVVDPATVPTFFLRHRHLGKSPPDDLRRTGDQVRQDDDGYLYFEGRTDDVIISAGYRIGPFEVESVLARHPAVADVAVVAAPDAERGSVVRAIVVLQPGRTPSAELASELQDFVKQRTAPYKYPRLVEFVAGLPKTTSGKIRRRELRLAAESP
jgi:acetyl-CoA synthetase